MHPHDLPQHRARRVAQDVLASDNLALPSAPLWAGAHTARGGPPIDKQPELGKSGMLGKLVKNKAHARALMSPASRGAGARRKK